MTDTTTDNQEQTEEIQLLPLDKIPHYYTQDGIPVFVGAYNNICDLAEAHGFQIYYVISYGKVTETVNGVKKDVYQPSIYRITNNIVARSVTEVGSDEVPLAVLAESANFNLPPIPNDLRQKVDDFFRSVDQMYGTEAIVLLTYDPSVGGTAGWGVLVPKQENTPAHCAYDQESVIEEKPDHVFIVGSIHSHPGMSAYASGTDHNDQADFDGIHITYGWSTKTNQQTEYHCELQIAGQNWNIKPDAVFEQTPQRAIPEEVKAWTDRVSKQHTAPKVTGQPLRGPLPTSQNGGNTTHTGTSDPQGAKPPTVTVPAGCPDPEANHVIVELASADAKVCPFCDSPFIPQDFEKRRCLNCHNYFALPGETLRDILALRDKQNVFTYDINIDNPTTVVKPIYMWKVEDGKNVFVEVFWPPSRERKSLTGGDQGK